MLKQASYTKFIDSFKYFFTRVYEIIGILSILKILVLLLDPYLLFEHFWMHVYFLNKCFKVDFCSTLLRFNSEFHVVPQFLASILKTIGIFHFEVFLVPYYNYLECNLHEVFNRMIQLYYNIHFYMINEVFFYFKYCTVSILLYLRILQLYN